MKELSPYKRSSLLAPFNELPHLFAVLNDPCRDGLNLLVMITSIKEGRIYDQACVLKSGDHPFIIRPSYLLYRMAETVKTQHISKMIKSRYYLKKEDFEAPVFQRIANGIYTSDETKLRILNYAKANKV